ncbi:MAG: SHOCT domain-containing protein [Cyanobacteria bacterium]|nr:SHOCT domain-containing protein [Cyanobacteria bacterium bin.51]
MEQLTARGLEVVNDLAQRYGFSQDAALHMTFAVLKGRGGMAQFNHPEFAGSGQWMNGGMMMLGDMFNQGLKARVDGLCQGLAAAVSSQPDLFPRGSFQSQSQSGGSQQMQNSGGMAPMAPMSFGSGALFTPDPQDSWWPAELGNPSSSGAQNEVRYAYFPAAGRLAVQVNGRVSLYDTSGHHISGLSQQQASGGGVVFSTGAGSISLTHLPTVSGPPAPAATPPTPGPTATPAPPPEPAATAAPAAKPASAPATPEPQRPIAQSVPTSSPAPAASPDAAGGAAPNGGTDVFATLEHLGELMQKGLLTEDEFTAKKAELLSRL